VGTRLITRAATGREDDGRRTRSSTSRVIVLVLIGLVALFTSSPLWCDRGPGIPLALDAAHNASLVRLLDRRDSVTGFVTVGEFAFGETWLRLLRCDHSLLGGVWIGHARAGVRQLVAQGELEAPQDGLAFEELALRKADSVYLTFVMVRRPLIRSLPERGPA
jgi:hypothetical protein